MRSRDYGRREIEVLRGEIERGTVIIKKKKDILFYDETFHGINMDCICSFFGLTFRASFHNGRPSR